jgi:hypothetical protein
MNTCMKCAAPLEPAWGFCYACGMRIDRVQGQDVECGRHPLNKAIGFCVVCSTPVCGQCEEKCDGKILCADPAHRDILQEWGVISQPESEFEAELLVRNLHHGGIDAKTFSLHNHVETRWMNEKRVLVFVKKTEQRNATVLLQELGLLDTK